MIMISAERFSLEIELSVMSRHVVASCISLATTFLYPHTGTTSFIVFLDHSALITYNDRGNGVCITVNVGAICARNRAVTLPGQC